MDTKTKKAPSEIVQVIIGTAGHVDHGKTSLVRTLTGCDTDRLPEEKLRHLSIDLGFAPCRLPGNRIVGIVDVPGHEDFIRNMIAGAASIDILMLVIAADDGIMPQTIEHLQIVSLLRRPKVMVVLSKVDLVDEVIQQTVTLEVKEFLAKMGFPDAPVIPFSAATGLGSHDVRRALDNLVAGVTFDPDTRAFRMNIERVFSVKGYGTVVTGIPISGSANVGETVELFPLKKKLVIRSIEAYKQGMNHAPAHSCAAINLRDIEPNLLERGMTISAPGKYSSTLSAVAYLKNITESLSLRRIQDVWFLAGTSKPRAKISLLSGGALEPGKSGFVHLRFSEPVVLAAGDRYVIRLQNPPTTLGGGELLATGTFGRRKITREILPLLEKAHQAIEEGDPVLADLIAGPRSFVTRTNFWAMAHRSDEEAEKHLKMLKDKGELLEVGPGTYLVKEKLPAIMESLLKAIEQYHKTHQYAWGIESTYMCKLFGLEARSLPGLESLITSSGEVVKHHNRFALPSFKPSLKAVDIDLKDKVLSFISEGGLCGQARGDIMKRFALTDAKYRLYAKILSEEGLVKTFTNQCMHIDYFEKVREIVLKFFESNEVISIQELRDALGSGRHFAVDLLEAFDAEGMTRRTKEGRVLSKRWKKGMLKAENTTDDGSKNEEK